MIFYDELESRLSTSDMSGLVRDILDTLIAVAELVEVASQHTDGKLLLELANRVVFPFKLDDSDILCEGRPRLVEMLLAAKSGEVDTDFLLGVVQECCDAAAVLADASERRNGMERTVVARRKARLEALAVQLL